MNAARAETFLYFAYGSNLLSRRLQERTPSARKLANGVLGGHALCWHKAAVDGSGKCDVVETAAATARVHGVVYEIALAEKASLDAAETLGVGYGEKQAWIDTSLGPVQAWLYVALRTDPDMVPYDWYHALVFSGAQEHGLPVDYIDALKAVASRTDPDAVRAARHFGLIQPW